MAWKIDWNTFLGSRRTKITLAVLIVIGLALRLFLLWDRSIWFDEAVSVQIAHISFGEIFSAIANAEFNPPFYFLLLKAWMFFLPSIAWGEVLSVLFGIAAIPVIYRLGKVLYNESVGIIAAGILTFACLQIRYSQEMRMYSLAVLLVLLSNYYFAKVTREERFRDGYSTWIKYVLVTVLSLYTHYYAVFNVLVQNAYLLLRYRDRGLRKLWMIAQGAVVVLLLPWIPSVLTQVLGVEEQYWIASPTIGKLFSVLIFLGDNLLSFAALFMLAIGALCSFPQLRQGKIVLRSEKRNFFLVGLIILPMLFSLVISLFTQSILEERYFILFAPALYLLAAKGYSHLTTRWTEIGFGLLFFAGMLLCLIPYYQSANTDYRDAATFVERYHQSGVLVIHTQPSTVLPFRMYQRQPWPEYILSSKILPPYLGGKWYHLDDYLTGTEDILALRPEQIVFIDVEEPNQKVARAMEGIAIQESQGKFGRVWVTIYRVTNPSARSP